MPHLHHGAVGSSWVGVVLSLALVYTALAYLRGWRHLRSTSSNAIAGWRAAGFLIGLLLIWIAVASPVAAVDMQWLTAHMIQHLLLMTLAPPLIWLGEPVGPLLHGLPQRLVGMSGPVFRRPPVEQLARALTRPAFCWLAAAVALVGWHIPAAFSLGMQSGTWHMVEHASFLAAGLLFWYPVIQPSRPGLAIILYLFFATLPCDILSGFLVFCDRVVYPVYFSSSRPFGLSALDDQQCAGALMWTCVTVVYLVAGTILTTRLLSPQSPRDYELAQLELRAGAVVQTVPRSLRSTRHGY